MQPTKAELDEQARKNQRAHRAAEAAALALLLRARNDAVDPSESARSAVARLRPSIRDAIVLGRQGARTRGVERLSAEANAIGAYVDVDLARSLSEFSRDWIRANRVSESYARQWLKKSVELDGNRAASLATRSALERIAVTESSEAFSSGRTAVALEARSETQLMRVWDSTLDKRTCEVCEGADGTIVGVAEDFPEGEPGGVHAHCRCGWTLTTVSFRSKE
jgi:murein DD-endopeptidase MepM/ murein hydrolase activator NlpD